MVIAEVTANASSCSEVPCQPASIDIWNTKYRLRDKQGRPLDATIDETYQRIARALADIEDKPEARGYWCTAVEQHFQLGRAGASQRLQRFLRPDYIQCRCRAA